MTAPHPTRRTFLLAAGALAIGTLVRREARASSAGPGGRGFGGRNAGEEMVIGDVRCCWCPPGHFVMGSPPGESGRRADEEQVAVTLTHGFWMAKFETTQDQWRHIVGTFPDRLPSDEFGRGPGFPMYWVNLPEAERFCAALTERAHRDGSLPEDWEWRLPTEAQWEYACRAGTTTATSFGDSLGIDQANFQSEPLGDGRGGVQRLRASPVGSYPANPWGICDMHGNIFEWCRDWYHSRLPGGVDPDLRDAQVGAVQNRDGTFSRVRRGGAWNDPGRFCRSALRLRYEPERRSDHIGFRVVAVQIR